MASATISEDSLIRVCGEDFHCSDEFTLFSIGIVNNIFVNILCPLSFDQRHIGDPQRRGEDILCQSLKEKRFPASQTCGGHIYQVVFHSPPFTALVLL